MKVEYSVFSGARHEIARAIMISDCSLVAEQSVRWSFEMRFGLLPLNREVVKATINRSKSVGTPSCGAPDVIAEDTGQQQEENPAADDEVGVFV